VMNKADAKRDAAALPPNETTWGWLPDGKTMTYPSMGSVDEQYGAFVVYADLAMINPGQSCDGSTGATGPLEQQVVTIATEEYTAWQSGTQDPKKYTNGKSENWCAAFVSWVYNKANYPLMTVVAVIGWWNGCQNSYRLQSSNKIKKLAQYRSFGPFCLA